MEENMADLNHAPSEELMRLYQAWANGTYEPFGNTNFSNTFIGMTSFSMALL
jgi:hypothetical protein